MRPILLAVALLAGACGGGATLATPTPTPTSPGANATPGATATPGTTPSLAPSASPSASPSPVTLPNTAQVAAAGNGVVWMLIGGDRLFRSTDRGASWTERTVPADGGSLRIAFTSDTTGFAMRLASPATQCQAQGFALFRTTDGAASWQPVSGAFDTAQCKENLAFVDAQHGYMTAYDPNAAPSVWRTSDGGAHWSASRLPDPPGFVTRPGGLTLRPGPVADFGGVLFVGAIGPGGGRDESHYVFRSNDGGASWTFAAKAPWAETGPIFLTPSRWIELLVPGPWTETTDGGATWHPFTTDYQQAAPIAPQFAFGDANVGYATVRGSIQRTTDGGAHWIPITTPGTRTP